MEKLVKDTVEVTPDDMDKAFIANFGKRVEVQMIAVNDAKLANKVWRMARDNNSEQFFGKLSNEYSCFAELRNNYGEFRPIQRYGDTSFLETEAFQLKPGDISAIVQNKQYWFIMRCKGYTEPLVQDFDAVKADLRKDIFHKKLVIAIDKYFGRMRSSAQIDNFMAGTSQTGREMIESARQPANGMPRR